MRGCILKLPLRGMQYRKLSYCCRQCIMKDRELRITPYSISIVNHRPMIYYKNVYSCRRMFSIFTNNFGKNVPAKPTKIPIKLMDFPPLIYPNPFLSLKSRFFEGMIMLKYGRSFSIPGIVEGASQALTEVSYNLSKGNFSRLEEFIKPAALQEIKDNYNRMDEKQRNFIVARPHDVFRRFLYELELEKDKTSGKEFAVATVVFHGYHGYLTVDFDGINPLKDMQDNPDDMFICNYKLVKELTKDLEKDWIISELNHFQASDYI